MAKATAIKPKKTTTKKKFDKKTYLDWYEKMYLMRKFEEKCGMLYTMQKFGGFCHLYIGQEAVAMGIVEAIGKADKVITAYRDHAFPLAMGTSADQCMAELYGKTTGTSKGKGGSMHFFDVERGFWGGHGIVGGQIGLGAGIAFSEKYKGTKNVVVCMMGDGAVRQGILHETYNMAMLWKLPVVFLVENNNYAMGTSVERTTNVLKLEKMGASYEMPSRTVDGMSVEAVFNAITEAAERARKGDGPTWLDVKTYRYKGHSMSDPQKYRTKEEVEKYKGIDPLQQVLSVIKDKKYATEKQIKHIEAKVKKIIEESVKFAEDSPVPEPSALYEDVYTQEDYPYIVE
ncbi:MAG: pyruvate dehydrogenase (acetyl-transferring) E1 component subunit alpha [Flavobacteriales bacterium]|jgi:pyruvate dehydrogenase E1 component alpha subunit|nr:pyruvate dehydrogenase (acetyl-transferring) E1 component subunit alpha [Flavobacteriales bacterium]